MIQMKSKKGLSAIIAMLLLVALTLVLVGIVWTVVNNLIGDKIEKSEACSLIFDKIKINSKFTCYASGDSILYFLIERGDIEVDKLIVAVAGETDSIIVDLVKDSIDEIFEIPGKKAGKTYEIDITGLGVPKSIKVAPVINGVSCEVADTLVGIDSCD